MKIVRGFICALCAWLVAVPICFAQNHQWPQWLGPDRDGLTDETGLLESWPEGGPPRAWLNRDCGAGYGGPAIVDGRLYILGTRDDQSHLFCFDAQNGEEIWTTEIATVFENDWGDGPRGTPSVDGDRVYALVASGTVICCRTDNGDELWRRTMQDLGGSTPYWGYSESVLIDDKQLLCTPGGEAGTVAALDKLTGELIWQSSEVTDGAHYSSIVKGTPHGQPQYFQLLEKKVIGLAVEDGRLLWEYPWPGRTAMIPTPVSQNQFVYQTAGYGAGCALLEIGAENNVEEIYSNKLMKNHHGGIILLDQHVYGHSDGVGWVCQEFRTGERVWRERSELEKGAIGYADGKFYCVGEDTGDVVLIDASTAGWQPRGRFTLEPQSAIRKPRGRVWTHPVIVNGRMYLRDQEMLYAYDVAAP